MLLGIDVGTTAAKALLVDTAGRVLGAGSAEYPTQQPHPGWSEQEAEDWWRALVAAARQALGQAGGSSVVGLAVSTQGDTLVPVDGDGRPLAPARTWMDTRTAHLLATLENQVGPGWYETTGSRPGAYAAALTIAWLRQERPAVYDAAARFSLVADFLCQRLTGHAVVDHPNASRTLLFDIHSREWDPHVLSVLGVDCHRLPRAVPAGAVVGPLLPRAAEELGLPPGITVAAGGHDQTCAAVGAGVVRPGNVLLSCGTAWVLLAAADRPLLDPGLQRVQTYCHAVPDTWALLTAHAGGNTLAWLRDALWPPGTTYEQMTAKAAQAAHRSRNCSLLFLPHFYGALSPLWMRHARGCLLGLTLSNTRSEVTLAVMEGVALEVARNSETLRAMGALPDVPHAEIRMIGGGARSDLWGQMVADATGVPVVRPQVREAAAYGAAVLAGVATGVFESVSHATAAVPVHDTLVPAATETAYYRERMELFIQACQALRSTWERLAGRSGGDHA